MVAEVVSEGWSGLEVIHAALESASIRLSVAKHSVVERLFWEMSYF